MNDNNDVIRKNGKAGHRKRLREKFIKSGIAGFHDYEIIELLLSLGTPRRDCKQQAKEAVRRFKTLRGVLEAPPEELRKISGIGPHNTFGIRLVQEIAREFLKEKLIEKPVYTTADEVFDYLYHSMRDLKKEVFKVVYLNSQNQIIDTEDLFHGTVNSSAVSPREVVESTLKHNAVSLIFAHNHPSGNPEPSKSDMDLTRDLIYAARTVQIKVLDHIIIGNNRYYSFAGKGLIGEYEMEYHGLKLSGTQRTKQDKTRTNISSPKLPWSE
ncbi:MAG TPA: JAB domain-containing protein [Dehalococcoidia bacterium]|nr:JAB domain-containing protein [Dehalococcoidia bacterium]